MLIILVLVLLTLKKKLCEQADKLLHTVKFVMQKSVIVVRSLIPVSRLLGVVLCTKKQITPISDEQIRFLSMPSTHFLS